MEIVKKLMTHVDKAEGTTYRDELLTKIIDICSQSNYQHITNFEWCVPTQSPGDTGARFMVGMSQWLPPTGTSASWWS